MLSKDNERVQNQKSQIKLGAPIAKLIKGIRVKVIEWQLHTSRTYQFLSLLQDELVHNFTNIRVVQ